MATPRRRTSVVVGGGAARRASAVVGGPPAGGGRRQSAVVAGLPGGAGALSMQSDLQTFNTFDRLLNESLRQSYFLGVDSYFMFWSCLTDERLAIQFVTQLITSVVEIDELIQSKKEPTKEKKSDGPSIARPLEEVGEELFGSGPDNFPRSMKAARAALMSTVMCTRAEPPNASRSPPRAPRSHTLPLGSHCDTLRYQGFIGLDGRQADV